MATPVRNSIPVLTDEDGNGSLKEKLISGLVQGGSWRFGSGNRLLTYSLDQNFDGPVAPWTQPWITALDKAFQAWENVADVKFRLRGTPDAQPQNLSPADISISLSPDALGPGVVGIGVFPDPRFADLLLDALDYSRTGGQFPFPRPEGDISFDNLHFIFRNLNPGSEGYYVLLHEIGHALGLKHTDDKGGNGRPTFSSLGIDSYDAPRYTVMEGQDFPFGPMPGTPMLADILAIQHIYGANMSYHAGNDTYHIENGTWRAIWDAGGIDTFSANSWDEGNRGVRIDLEDGQFSGTRGGKMHTGIAFNAVIENAIGSDEKDSISGNDADNRLDGRGGDDVMNGGEGDDIYIVDHRGDRVTENPNAGTDTIRSTIAQTLREGVEHLVLVRDRDIDGIGNDAANGLTGNAGRNLLQGNGGADTLAGGGGRDTLIGGAGDDTYVRDGSRDVIIELTRPDVARLTPNASWAVIDLSADDRYVLFGTSEIGVVPGDGNTGTDLLVLDRETGELVPVTVGPDGRGFGAGAGNASISSDGRYVIFESSDSGFVPGDTNIATDIFMRDLEAGTTVRLSLAADGSEIARGHTDSGGGHSHSISDDGRYLVFTSDSPALAPGEMAFFNNGDVFVKDLQTGAVTLVSEEPDGDRAGGSEGEISGDGRFVLFRSSERMLGEDSSLRSELFVMDLESREVTHVSVAEDETRGNDHSFSGSISADGRYVAFSSLATNLVPGDTNGLRDIFLKDLQEGTLTRISTTSSGQQAVGPAGNHQQDPVISADGRFVLFSSMASNLVPGDTNDYIDVFVKNLETGEIARVSLTEEGGQLEGPSHRIGFSEDARYILFSGSNHDPLDFYGPHSYMTANPFIGGEVVFDPGGYDSLRSSVTCVLPEGIERLILTGTETINGTGNALDNKLTGNNKANILQGRPGDDLLVGKAGADQLFGGDGDDVFIWDPQDARVHGGEGVDTLEVGAGNLDLTGVDDSKIVLIERIDLSAPGANVLKLSEADILAISSDDTLRILGGGSDAVDIEGAFTMGAEADGFVTYTVGTATLLIDADITNVA